MLLKTFTSGELIMPLVRLLAEKRLQNNHPSQVGRHINKKFKLGGYGQYPSRYLDELDFSETGPDLKETLTIGWVYPDTPSWLAQIGHDRKKGSAVLSSSLLFLRTISVEEMRCRDNM